MTPSVTIAQESPGTADGIALIGEMQDYLVTLYNPENLLGFSVEKLIAQGVAFFVLRENGIAAACGGILLVDGEYGELKRMFVRPEFRGRGYARRVIERLTAYAQERGIDLLRLETGVHQQAAIRLYESLGFRRIPPFGGYVESGINLCYEKPITGTSQTTAPPPPPP